MVKNNLSKSIYFCIIFAIFIINAVFCQTAFAQGDLITELGFSGKKIYTAYNLWYEPGKEASMWCINYKTGNIIPAGTEVTNVGYTRTTTRGAERLAISFKTAHDGKRYCVNIQRRFHPGKNIRDYGKYLFTDKNIDQITSGMSEEEIDSIKKGGLVVGMSKKAVLAAYGYPPEHKTQSLEGNVWMYWMNRFRSKKINFDDNGKTYKPPEKEEDENAL